MPDRSAKHFDPAPPPGRPGQPLVGGEQDHLQRLSEGDIRGVVDAEIVPKLPAAGQQRPVRCPPKGQGGEVG